MTCDVNRRAAGSGRTAVSVDVSRETPSADRDDPKADRQHDRVVEEAQRRVHEDVRVEVTLTADVAKTYSRISSPSSMVAWMAIPAQIFAVVTRPEWVARATARTRTSLTPSDGCRRRMLIRGRVDA